MKIVEIETDYIRLDQALKFTGIAESGAKAKELIKEGLVMVNGERETRRGKKLRSDDLVAIGDIEFKIK